MTKIARPGSEGNMRLLKQYGGGSTPPRQHFATGGAVRSGGNPALDEGLFASGQAARPNLSRPGRKAKKDKDKAKTNINIVLMGKDKDAAPPAMPPGGPMAAAGPMPPPPMPMPMKPPMGPPMAGPDGPPMPMRANGGRVSDGERQQMSDAGAAAGRKMSGRGEPLITHNEVLPRKLSTIIKGAEYGGMADVARKAGGRVNRADGGAVEEQGWVEARARFPKLSRGAAPKASSGPSGGSAVGGSLDAADRLLNGPLPRPMRAIMGNPPKKPAEDKPSDDATKKASGGRAEKHDDEAMDKKMIAASVHKHEKSRHPDEPITKLSMGGPAKPPVGIDDGAGGGMGRLQKIKAYGK